MPDISPIEYPSQTNPALVLKKIQLPDVRLVNNEEFPVAFNLSGADDASLAEKKSLLVQLTSKGVIDSLLAKHGAVVLRGFKELDPKIINQLIDSIEKTRNHVPFQQVGVLTGRTQYSENIFSANEGPPSVRIHQHVEFCRFKNYPKTLVFIGYKINDIEGGETPLLHTAELYNELKETYPEFIDKLVKKGLYLSQTWLNENEATGFTWDHRSAFGKDIEKDDTLEVKRRKAEKTLQRVSDDFEWTEEGDLKVNQHTKPVRIHPKTGNPGLFSSLPTFYANLKHKKEDNGPVQYKFGSKPFSYDDEEKEDIDESHLEGLFEISKKLEYKHKWEQGDIVLIDNYQTSHGRLPWTGEGNRVVLVSMWDDKDENKVLPEIAI